MHENDYLMENDEEALRLEVKTDEEVLRKQARWAGIAPGMRIADIGCGAGVTTEILHGAAQPGGSIVGIDVSEKRISHALGRYAKNGIQFQRRDMLHTLDDLGTFDFVWVRFVLEYFLADSYAVVENISRLVKPGGILCLIDLDYNCLSHYGMSERMERTLFSIVRALQEKADFDPYVGRKLYSYLYDLGYVDIDVEVSAHHLIFGELRKEDSFNWLKKVETAPRKIGYTFPEYEGGYDEFLEEFHRFFSDPRRFTYSPIISVRGRRPED